MTDRYHLIKEAASEIVRQIGGGKIEEGKNANGYYVKLVTGDVVMWGDPIGETLPVASVSGVKVIIPDLIVTAKWFIVTNHDTSKESRSTGEIP